MGIVAVNDAGSGRANLASISVANALSRVGLNVAIDRQARFSESKNKKDYGASHESFYESFKLN